MCVGTVSKLCWSDSDIARIVDGNPPRGHALAAFRKIGLPMSYYSSYSTERDLPRRRYRRDTAVQLMVAVMLALFVSVGTTWAGAEPKEEKPAPAPADVTVCRDGVTTTVKDNQVKASDAAGACAAVVTPPAPTAQETCETTAGKVWRGNNCVDVVVDNPNNNVPACAAPSYLGDNGRVCKVDVCNPSGNGKIISVDASAIESHTLPPCAQPVEEEEVPTPIDPDITVCRDSVTLTIKTSEKLESDVAGKCVANENNNPPACTPPAVVAANGNACEITICHRGGQSGTQTINVNGYHPESDTLPVNGICATPPVDVCPDEDLNPGVQTEGATCVTEEPTDLCTDEELNPGVQLEGPCTVAAPTDACPDEELNPGPQAAGATCIVDVCPNVEGVQTSSEQCIPANICELLLNIGNIPVPVAILTQLLDRFGCVDHCTGDLNPGVQPSTAICVTPPPVDACTDEALNPGVQQTGVTCIVATPPPVDACPDDLNPGIQETGATCIVATPVVVDACPDALNPGVQAAGTTCITAPATTPAAADTSGTGTGGTAAVGGDSFVDPAVDTDHDPTLGDAEAPGDEEVAAEDEVDAGGDADGDDVDAADAVVGDGDSLPYTGFTLGSAWGAGIIALLLGAFSFAEASRAARRRRMTVTS
ncbi:MAG: hypothetical protein JWM86_1083 [Thermoleophilia bacterium]|nr:hypothetical protein [Thermoleophilia bacterium]